MSVNAPLMAAGGVTLSAAELRRERILRNGQKRLDLLIGVKNSENGLASNAPIDVSMSSIAFSHERGDSIQNSNQLNNIETNFSNTQSHFHSPLTSSATTTSNHSANKSHLNSVNISKPNLTETNINRNNNVTIDDQSVKCSFNGYTNKEILIFFMIALCSSLSFIFDVSQYICQNAMLPFITFELAHLVVHYNYIPSTNPQFQMFKTLLGLCGISQKSLKNLMIVFNFLFILIDHFVIYIFCLVAVNMALKLVV